MRALELEGQVFGRLTVLGRFRTTKTRTHWRCRCSCGKYTIVRVDSLTSGTSKSCGCLAEELHITHGHYRNNKHSPTYSSWANMKKRCLSSKYPRYRDYGGRGITVCDRWLDFNLFLEDMGLRPGGMSIDRLDNDGNYEPSNCKWSTPKQQANNRRKPKGGDVDE